MTWLSLRYNNIRFYLSVSVQCILKMVDTLKGGYTGGYTKTINNYGDKIKK
jgi:hypothetical protein